MQKHSYNRNKVAQAVTDRKTKIKHNRRKLYKKYLNFGIPGIDPCVKHQDPWRSGRKIMKDKSKNDSFITCLPNTMATVISKAKPPIPKDFRPKTSKRMFK